MARQAQLKTIYRKTKIVLTYRGKKIHEEKRGSSYAFDNIEAFKRGFNQSRSGPEEQK